MVRSERLELSHLSAPEPKSGAFTNSANDRSKAFTLAIWKLPADFMVCLSNVVMAGLPGFEPGNAGIKSQCLYRLAIAQQDIN